MTDDKEYPYGYQLSFLERLKLRLKKLNYRLSIGLAISYFVLAGIAHLMLKLVPESQYLLWHKLWRALIFFLFGLQGIIWIITGEIKRFANVTYRGRWVTIVGVVLLLYCLSMAIYIFFI